MKERGKKKFKKILLGHGKIICRNNARICNKIFLCKFILKEDQLSFFNKVFGSI